MQDADYTRLRTVMVDEQLVRRGIKSGRVLDAMRRIPRHYFVADAYRAKAYDDEPQPIPCGQTISQPYMVAVMTELLELSADAQVLEIGAGTGYQAAVLSLLVKSVVTVERHAELAAVARVNLASLAIENVHVREGDGTLGAADRAPFDAILVAAGAPEVPETLMNQLRVGGRLICPVGDRTKQELMVVRRGEEGFEVCTRTQCRFVPLIGEEGWTA